MLFSLAPRLNDDAIPLIALLEMHHLDTGLYLGFFCRITQKLRNNIVTIHLHTTHTHARTTVPVAGFLAGSGTAGWLVLAVAIHEEEAA